MIIWQDDRIQNLQLALKIKDEMILDMATRHVAEWKSGKTPNGQWGYYCSICSASFVGENAEWIAKEHDYCPKCGAKMKGENK